VKLFSILTNATRQFGLPPGVTYLVYISVVTYYLSLVLIIIMTALPRRMTDSHYSIFAWRSVIF